MVSERNRWRRPLLSTLALPAGIAVLLFGTCWMIDFYALPSGARQGAGPLTRLLAFDPNTLRDGLGNLAQIVAAVLGIAITVVSIVVQLAATRYTSRVADMFFRDRINLAMMGFFVVACIDAMWVSLAVGGSDAALPLPLPLVTVLVTITIVTASLLALIPYFAYVFDFLDPEKVIARIGQQTLRSALGQRRRSDRAEDSSEVERRQAQTAVSIEQLADVAVNAVGQKDKVIACDAIAAIRRILVEYLPQKMGIPSAWFAIPPALRRNPDLVALDSDAVADLADRRVWLEWKGLRQMRGIFAEALKAMPQMAHVVAIETRYVALAALSSRDQAVLILTVKFMNTYLRAALNARDVGTAYNVLNQYRQLGEAILAERPAASRSRSGVPEIDEGARAAVTTQTAAVGLLTEMGGYFRYYAQLANGMGMGFIAETAAYDLAGLCETASVLSSPAHDALLAAFLDIDKEAENAAQERGLRGVRKAQAKLAAYYLLSGATPRARQIFDDMALESTDRLRSIRDEMLAISSKDFWEIIDRGTNFDYVDENRKAKLREFFAWFPDLGTDSNKVDERKM